MGRAGARAVAVGGGAAGPSSSYPSSSSCSSAPNRERGSGPLIFSREVVDVAGADDAAKAADCGSAAGAGAEAKVKSPKLKSSSRKGAGGSGNATGLPGLPPPLAFWKKVVTSPTVSRVGASSRRWLLLVGEEDGALHGMEAAEAERMQEAWQRRQQSGKP